MFVRLLFARYGLAAILPLLAVAGLSAQQRPTAGHASCPVAKTPPTAVESAFFEENWAKALQLATAAYTRNPQDSRDRQLAVDTLIAKGDLVGARKLFELWAAQAQGDPVATVTAGELRFAEGDWLEAYAMELQAINADPCLPDAYAMMAHYEELAGYRVTAAKHYALAHRLSPNDPIHRLAWISTLGRNERATELQALVEDTPTLSPVQRKRIDTQIKSLTSEKDTSCQLVSLNGPATIPMVPISGPTGVESYGLEIAFNGHKRTLQIDTGATGFLLTRFASSNLGLHAGEKRYVGGFGGDGASTIDHAVADSITVGGLTFHNCPVDALVNTNTLSGSDLLGHRLSTNDGLVGSDIFDRYLVTLDYAKHEIRLAPLPSPPNASPSAATDPLGGSNDPQRMQVDRYVAPSMKSWTDVYRRDHELIVPARITGPSSSLKRLFMLDTGAEFNLIDTATAKQITRADANPGLLISGVAGRGGGMSEASRFTLDFANLRLPVSGMDAIDLSHFGGVYGFLGYPTLSQLIMQIDYRDNLVHFEAPDGKTRP